MPRVSELDNESSGPLNGDELVAVVQGGTTVKTTTQHIADLASAGTGTVTSVNGDPGPAVTLDAADVGATIDPSLLSGVSNLTGNEILTVEQGGTPVQVTTQQIAGLASSSGTPGGSNTQVQFNDSSAFGGDAEFTYDKTNNLLTVRQIHLGSGNGDSNGIAGDDKHWFNVTNDPSVVAGLGTAGLQLLRVNSYGSGGYGGNVHFCRYRGTLASPTAVQSGDTFMSFGIRGWDSGGALSQSAASWAAVATENWTGSAHGIKFRWETTPNGSTTRALAMELDGNGKLTPNALANKFTALTDGANISVNGGVGNNFRVTLGGNRTLDNPSNMSDGQVFNFRIAQDATGSRTLAYGSKYKWPGGSAPTLTTTANAIDVISCIYDSTSDTLMCAIQKAFG